MIGVAGQSKPRLLSRSSRPAAAAFRRVASPVTATTDFLEPDILNKCGRAVPPLTLMNRGTRPTMVGGPLHQDHHASVTRITYRVASVDVERRRALGAPSPARGIKQGRSGGSTLACNDDSDSITKTTGDRHPPRRDTPASLRRRAHHDHDTHPRSVTITNNGRQRTGSTGNGSRRHRAVNSPLTDGGPWSRPSGHFAAKNNLRHGCRSRCEAQQNRWALSGAPRLRLPGLFAWYPRRRRR
jgi:hypothetical protein